MTAFSTDRHHPTAWQTALILILSLWLGGCLVLDFLVMPGLYASGMMSQSDFAAAGSMVFGTFNHVELFAAAAIATGTLAMSHLHDFAGRGKQVAIALAILLLAVVAVDTYAMTPQMSALGVQLNSLDGTAATPAGMNEMHLGYWVLELLKLGGASLLLGLHFRAANR